MSNRGICWLALSSLLRKVGLHQLALPEILHLVSVYAWLCVFYGGEIMYPTGLPLLNEKSGENCSSEG